MAREDKVIDETKLFLSQLSWNLNSEQLQTLLTEHVPTGTLVSAEVFTRKDGRSLGCATVTLTTAEATKTAISTLNGMNLGGRNVGARECYVE